MLWIHPVIQIAVLGLALYVLRLGWVRFAFNHLGRKGAFLWKRHVLFGKATVVLWIYGAAVGAAAAWVTWRMFGITGYHFWTGIAVVVLALTGYTLGWHMDAHKKKRKYLPLVHGAANLIAILLSLTSLITGLEVIQKYLLKP
ncbi:MAG TPA: DUF4079 family protein [Thermodesulfobacteriota bacterium]|nr:DUF4079 family protein [Deltaproteobacteria bacterium]HNR12166.1 DUF4079 family protein [Thermodesulfobacteriota bacterium]HNU72822.1 DUF4079 family protein [Thermodesulfobacteriota bacterium]